MESVPLARSTGPLARIACPLLIVARLAAVFLTALPCYLVGFSCDAPCLSPPWWVAVAIGFAPTALTLLGGGQALPEAWPCSPVALFMWPGPQARALADHTMSGDERLALSAATRPLRPGELIGRRVVPHGPAGARLCSEAGALHDAMLRLVGFTLCHVDALQVCIAALAPRVSLPRSRALRRLVPAHCCPGPAAHSRSSAAPTAATPLRLRPPTFCSLSRRGYSRTVGSSRAGRGSRCCVRRWCALTLRGASSRRCAWRHRPTRSLVDSWWSTTDPITPSLRRGLDRILETWRGSTARLREQHTHSSRSITPRFA